MLQLEKDTHFMLFHSSISSLIVFNWVPLFKLISFVLRPGRTDVIFWNTCIYFNLSTSVSTYTYKLCHPRNFPAGRRYLTSSRCLLYIVKSVRHHSYRMNYEGNVMRVLFLSGFFNSWHLVLNYRSLNIMLYRILRWK